MSSVSPSKVTKTEFMTSSEDDDDEEVEEGA